MEQTNDIVEYLARSNTVEGLCRATRVHPAYIKDLTQDIYIILLQLENTKLKDLYDNGQLKFWLVRVIKNQYNGGPFFKRWRMHQHQDLESIMYKI